MAIVELVGVSVRKGDVLAADDLGLTIPHGKVMAILGATGSGKSTLLRAIAGLDELDAGSVHFDGTNVTAWPTRDRDVAFAFQRPALLPHRTARRNIAMPLELSGTDVAEIRERVGAESRALQIESLLNARPDQLSLGQAHAVQIARSLVKQPTVLLLDEPFASIDPEWRSVLRRELMIIQRGFEVTTVIALNDPADALLIADAVAVIEHGRVLQVGSPSDVHDRPATLAVAQLTGPVDASTVAVEADGSGAWLVADGFRMRAWQPSLLERAGRRLQLVTRPTWWEIDPNGLVEAGVDSIRTVFDETTIRCRAGSLTFEVVARQAEATGLETGGRVRLRLARYRLIDPLTGRAFDLS